MADPDYKSMIRFLRDLGIEDLAHTGSKGYLAHLVAVHRDLERWGCSQDVCRAGLFHSIYGTEKFQLWALPIERRDDVRALIGERAELLAYVNCMMDRASFDSLLESNGPYSIRHRLTTEPMELSRADYDDLVRVHLCDWLEQVARCGEWDYRPTSIRKMADRLGGVAKHAYQEVYAEVSGVS